MTVSETFSEWYERMKSTITDQIGPGQQKGEELDSCVRQVMAQGHDRESAYAICNDTLKADFEKSERDELLGTAREMSKYDPQVPLTYTNLIEYAGVDVKGEDDLELPKSCRRCDTATRAKGSFMCPDCDPAINAETDDFDLVGSGVQEAKGEDEDGEETEKSEEPTRTVTRRVYLDHGLNSDVPGDAVVRAGEKGLYYEADVDVDVEQKADPMANGHQLDPETGEGTCESTGKEIEAETMKDLSDDCPHCGEALSVFDQKSADVDQKADGYGVDVVRVLAAEDDDTDYNGNVLGLGVDFPESGVYIDWRREAFPDQLDDPHVSEYGSLEDLESATGNVIEHVERYQTAVDIEQKLAEKASVPDNAVSISSRDEAPEGAKVIEGDRGGLYYVPEGGEAGDDPGAGGNDKDLAGLADEDGLLDAEDLEDGDRVEIHGDEVELDAVASDETGTVVQFEKDGEDFFLYEDMIDIRPPGGDAGGDGDGGGEGDGDGQGDGEGQDDGPEFEPGDEIESPSGEPAEVTAYDESTDVVAYETEEGEEMLMPASSVRDEEPEGPSEQDAELQDRLGVSNVNTEGLDDEQTERMASAFEDFQETQDLSDNSVMAVTTQPPDGDESAVSNTAASYSASSRTMYVNPEYFEDEHHQESFENGTTATESPEGTVNHELTHAEHFSEVLSDPEMNLNELQKGELPDEEAEAVADEVSWYASTSPVELVAEVKSGMMEGREFSDEVMEAYEKYGGPGVNT